MPTYDYRCPGCGAEFSAFVTMSRRNEVPCPECDRAEVEQRVTSFYHSGSAAGACAPGRCASCAGCR